MKMQTRVLAIAFYTAVSGLIVFKNAYREMDYLEMAFAAASLLVIAMLFKINSLYKLQDQDK